MENSQKKASQLEEEKNKAEDNKNCCENTA